MKPCRVRTPGVGETGRRNAPAAAKACQADTETAPIRYVAELIGADTDRERAIWWRSPSWC